MTATAAPQLSISQENYLKAILEAQLEGEPLIAATLARWLDVSPPAVTNALARLKRDALILVNDDGQLRLTDSGRAIADRIRYRHYLIERMLTEIFGMEWYKVHDEAERLEHAVSDEFEHRLAEILGLEADCPHGTRLDLESVESRRAEGWQKLSELQAGERAVVRSCHERSRALLEYFDRQGLRPGTAFTVVTRNEDETMTLAIDGRQVHLGDAGAHKIWVLRGG